MSKNKNNKNDTKNYLTFSTISNNYLKKNLPTDIICKIFYHYKLLFKIKFKWRILYTKINLAINSTNPAVQKLHEYHDFARNITMTGHLCYEKNEWKIAQKLIKLSTTIHFLVSKLIMKTIKLREIFF